MTRVLVVSQAHELWGAERSVLGLAPRLTALGIELRLAAPATGPFPDAWRAAGYEHVPLDLPEHRGIRAEGGGRPGAGALAAELTTVGRWTTAIARLAGGAHVVHSNSLWGHLETAVAGRIARRPVVVELHDLVAPGAGQRLLRAASRLARVTIAISRSVAAGVGGADDHRVRVVPQAVDVRRFAPGSRDARQRAELGPADVPLVGVVGRLDPEKAVHVIVRAVAALPPPHDRTALVVVGRPFQPGNYARELRAEASRLLGSRVRFIDHVDDVPALLRALDVLVSASPAEPFGLSLLEAQATGVPVVAARGGGVPEFVADGSTGLLFEPGDVAGLTEELDHVLSDDALAQKLALVAREQAVTSHDLDGRAQIFADLYRELAR